MHIPCINLLRTDLCKLKLHHICLWECKVAIRQTNLIWRMLKDQKFRTENKSDSAKVETC